LRVCQQGGKGNNASNNNSTNHRKKTSGSLLKGNLVEDGPCYHSPTASRLALIADPVFSPARYQVFLYLFSTGISGHPLEYPLVQSWQKD
jgi:hypothetical protein